MPLPTPVKSEDKKKFTSRCMTDPVMKREYKEKDQRLAVCIKQFMKKGLR